MKLIKLINSDNQQGQFYNILNSDLIIPAKAKIALSSIITEQELKPLVITNKNNKVFIQLILDNTKEIYLKLGNYTIDNINLFLDDFNFKLNSTLQASGKAIGFEYQVSIDNNSEQFSIIGLQSDFKYYNDSWITNAITLNVNRRVYKDTDEVLLEKSYCIYPEAMCQGASIIQSRIYKLDDTEIGANELSFTLGLLKSSDIQDIDDKTNWLLGITAGKTTDAYVIHYNGSDTITTTTPDYIGVNSNQNDLIQIQKTENKYNIVVYNQSNPNGLILFTTDILENDDLENYGFVRLYQYESAVELTYLQLTPSPFTHNRDNSLASTDLQLIDGYAAVPKQITNETFQSFEFDNYQLAKLLGYSDKSSGLELTKELIFFATSAYNFSEMVDAFQVELMNLKVDSYDCKIQGRNNILAIVPQSFNERNQIVYQMNTPIFLDLLNANEVRLNQINIRLVKLDGTPLQVKGDSVMVILIKNENE